MLRKDVSVDFASGIDISSAFEEVALPYKAKPGELVEVSTVEGFDLSKHIGIMFYTDMIMKPFPSLADMEAMQVDFADRDFRWIWDGWIDPGYKGPFSRQPRTYNHDGRVIRPGDVLGYGGVFFFENGVEREYGRKELASHYQRA